MLLREIGTVLMGQGFHMVGEKLVLLVDEQRMEADPAMDQIQEDSAQENGNFLLFYQEYREKNRFFIFLVSRVLEKI